MDVSAAIASRKSVRAFSNRKVAITIIREILEISARAPSGSNLQPWHVYVLTGRALEAFICV